MKRPLLLALLAVTLWAVFATPATAKPPQQPPSIEVPTPSVTCKGNDLVVEARVTTDGTMRALSMRVDRWEEVATPPFYVAGQLEPVERFIAELGSSGKNASPVPASHTLDTADRETWGVRLYFDPATYLDTSTVWDISVQAWAAKKRVEVEASFRGTYDCSLPAWVSHTYPAENIEYGDL